jgi:hypothetical protein
MECSTFIASHQSLACLVSSIYAVYVSLGGGVLWPDHDGGVYRVLVRVSRRRYPFGVPMPEVCIGSLYVSLGGLPLGAHAGGVYVVMRRSQGVEVGVIVLRGLYTSASSMSLYVSLGGGVPLG